jgi:hypothetical protein
VTAPSNAAVDEVTRRLMQPNVFADGGGRRFAPARVFRFGREYAKDVEPASADWLSRDFTSDLARARMAQSIAHMRS